MDQYEDLLLIEQIKSGSASAYQKLFDHYYTLLISYSMKYQDSLEEAREIVQQLFITIYEKRETLQIRVSLKAYLLKSVYYESIRKNRKEVYLIEVKEENLMVNDDLLVEAENEARIWDAVHQLTEQQQRILKMSRFEGYSNDEIAATMGISKRTVETHISNALKILKGKLLGLFFFFF